MTDYTFRVFAEIRAERQRQDRQWGGLRHDRLHEPNIWIALLVKHLGILSVAIFDKDWAKYRHRLIVLAALATAAIETYDDLHDDAVIGSPFVNFTEDNR